MRRTNGIYQSQYPIINDWLALLCINHAALTCEAYGRDLELFVHFLGDEEKLPKATPRQIQSFIAMHRNEGASPASVRRKLAAIRTFFEYARKEKMCPHNPALYIVGPKIPKRLPIVLDEEEVQRILGTKPHESTTNRRKKSDFLKLRNCAIMQLLYASGLRRMEIAALDLNKVSIEKRMLRVVGKGNKERIALFNDEAAEALKAYLELRPSTLDKAFFVGRSGARLTPQMVWEIFRSIADQVDTVTHATPHVMRHSFATHMLDDDADIELIRAMLGHASLATTGIYLHASQESMRSKFDRTHERRRERLAQESIQ